MGALGWPASSDCLVRLPQTSLQGHRRGLLNARNIHLHCRTAYTENPQDRRPQNAITRSIYFLKHQLRVVIKLDASVSTRLNVHYQA